PPSTRQIYCPRRPNFNFLRMVKVPISSVSGGTAFPGLRNGKPNPLFRVTSPAMMPSPPSRPRETSTSPLPVPEPVVLLTIKLPSCTWVLPEYVLAPVRGCEAWPVISPTLDESTPMNAHAPAVTRSVPYRRTCPRPPAHSSPV